ncbi:hypothetical protein ACROYT_G014349 [Oculina patagonica]
MSASSFTERNLAGTSRHEANTPLTSTRENPGSGDISLRHVQLLAQLNGLTNQVSRIERLLDSFINCKGCIKKACKACATSTCTTSFPVQNNIAPKPVVNMLIKNNSKACPETLKPTKTQASENVGSGPSIHPVDSNDSIMVGNPKHGIYKEVRTKKEAGEIDEDYRKLLSSKNLHQVCHGNLHVNAVKQLASPSLETNQGDDTTKIVSDKSHCEVRDWLLTHLLIDNSGRSENRANMTTREFNDAVLYKGTNDDPARYEALSKDHKTAKVYGSEGRSKGVCFGCLEKGHLSESCVARLKCKKCAKSHPTSLHEDSKNKKEPPKEGDAVNESGVQAVSNCVSTSDVTVVNSMILPVWLHHKDRPQTEVLVYALLDNASDTTFIKTSTLEDLSEEGPEVRLKLYTLHGNAEIPVQKVDGLVVERFDKKVQLELPKAYSRDSIPARRNQIPRSETASRWPHLQRIKNKIPPYQEQLEVGILIWMQLPRAIKPREVITGKGDDPYAIKTLLGWGIIGPVTPVKELLNDVKNEDIKCHRIVIQEIGENKRIDSKFVINAQTKEVINPYQVKEMFEIDFSERNNGGQALSQDDRRFLARVKEGIRHWEDGHYEMPLPLKDPNTKLPNYREMAFHRLKPLKRRFASDAKY